MRPLKVQTLLERSFQEVGCWTLDGETLCLPARIPSERGVYAFAIGETVVYVGLASQSLIKRLTFYGRPGASQPTNLRLNKMISERTRAGQIIRIFCAHPADQSWNGWRISGPQGLEAALIDDFDLEWNIRRSRPVTDTKIVAVPRSSRVGCAPKTAPASLPRGQRQTNVRARILDYVRRRPGMTELELAKAIYGQSAAQQQANAHCRALLAQGLVERRGSGGREDPFIYYPKR